MTMFSQTFRRGAAMVLLIAATGAMAQETETPEPDATTEEVAPLPPPPAPEITALAEPAPVQGAVGAPPVEKVIADGTSEGGGSGGASGGASGGGLIMPDGRMMLNFRNAPLNAVLTFLSETTGVVVVSSVEIDGRVNVISRQPVTIDEALVVLSAVLKEKGYAAVRTGKTLKIMTLDSARQSNIPVQSGSDPMTVAETDEMITQVIPVRFADAGKLKDDLKPLIPEYANLAANVSTNTLIMTDTAANVRRIMQVIKALDTAVSAVTQVKVFTLKYANASNAARLLTEIFQADQTTTQQQGRGGMPFFRRFGEGPQQQQQADGARPQLKVTAAADDRTNTIVVSAPTDIMPVIEKVLADLDANPAQDQAVFVFYFRNAQAENAETVVNNLFGTTGTGRTSNTSNTTNRNQNTTNRTGGTGTNRTGTTANRNTTAQNRSATTGRTGQVSASTAQAAAGLSGQVYAVADPDTNSLLVMTASGNFDRVKQVLDELDRPVPQVLIKVLIAEVTHSDDTDLGVEFSAINLSTSGDTTIFTDFGVAAATGGLITKIVEPDISVAIRALEKVGKLDVLSRPYILTSDNQSAEIIVGQRVPLITNSRITDTGQTINTLNYQDVGIILNVTPHVNPDGLVVLDVSPEISALTGESVPISDTASQPVIANRSAQTRVAIPDGKTIVIGGLMEDRKTETISKVPILGDIPLAGILFRRTEKKKEKTELLIFLTPHVAKEPHQLEPISQAERDAAVVVPKAVEPGTFDQHMEGMKRGGAKVTAPVESTEEEKK